MLIVVMAWVTVIGPHQPGDFRMAELSAVGYFNNWWLILHDVSYFARFAPPSPLNHLWSLSVEEQFYIVWPFLLMAALHFVPEAKSKAGPRPRLAAVALVAALCSGILMAVLYHPSLDPSRVYYGTDTRALELLVGAALAMVWPSRRLTAKVTPQARRTIDAAGLAGLVVIGLMFWQSSEFSPFLYRGGFALLAIGTALSVAAFAHPASRLGPIVGCKPMRWIGERSYGIYLWTLPIIVLTSPQGAHGPNLLRAILQVAAIMAVAELSWRYVENPIRHGALGRLWAQWKAGELAARAGAARGLGADRRRRPRRRLRARRAGRGRRLQQLARGRLGQRRRNDHRQERQAQAAGDDPAKASSTSATRPPRASSPKNICPIPNQLISAQYARVGATTQHLEVSGARSIYENYEGEPNAQEVAEAWKNEGFKGCWVIAMGTNEAANVAAGSTVHLRRPDRPDDVDDRRRTGDVGERQVTGAERPLRGGEHGELGQSAARGLRPLPQHAHLQLGRRRQGQLVHPRRDPLHLGRLRGARPPDRRRAAGSVPQQRRPPKMTDADDCVVSG